MKKRRDEISKSYRRVAENLVALAGVPNRHPKRHRFLEMLDPKSGFVIDDKPRLLIFGFDDDQKKGCTWKPYRKKLEESLPKRLRLSGKPGGLSPTS